MNAAAPSANTITSQYAAIAESACQRLAKDLRVRRNLPAGGRLRMDRQLPFLCLTRGKDAATRELITTEAAYVFASDDAQHFDGLSHLCRRISTAMQEHFGTFLLIEVWAGGHSEPNRQQQQAMPVFEIVCQESEAIPGTIAALSEALQSIRIGGRLAQIHRCDAGLSEIRGLPSLASVCTENGTLGCCELGLKINPVYRDQSTGVVFPVVLQGLRWKLATALRKTVAEFTGNPKDAGKTHYDSFGPSALVKAARLIDQQLCEVAESFDFLLQVTPTNNEEAREQFRASGSRELPPLTYRHLPYHPNLLKRRLFDIEIERVEDPTLAHLYWEKQDELDRQLTSLRDLHAPELTQQEYPQQSNFLTSSLQLYGGAEDSLVELATEILRQSSSKPSRRPRNRLDQAGISVADVSTVSQTSGQHRDEGGFVTSDELVAAAREEIDYYHSRMHEFNAKVEVCDSIASGIMVSRDRLLIAPDAAITKRRIAPLLHHEIGTHLLTYFNGRCQPFRQLYVGLAGYEELQEGLEMLAEYLVGGLSRKRLRTLASRVMAVHWMIAGKPFAEVFTRLLNHYRIAPRQAFTTTLRVFRGGGLTKDIIYLRGLRDLLAYLGHSPQRSLG